MTVIRVRIRVRSRVRNHDDDDDDDDFAMILPCMEGLRSTLQAATS